MQHSKEIKKSSAKHSNTATTAIIGSNLQIDLLIEVQKNNSRFFGDTAASTYNQLIGELVTAYISDDNNCLDDRTRLSNMVFDAFNLVTHLTKMQELTSRILRVAQVSN